MPDPLLKTISASQAAALWNASPYLTRWMLWQQFANGLVRDEPESSRMLWGKRLEPLVLEDVARDWHLEVTPNHEYVRNGLLGATRDAHIIAPDKGPGSIEVKSIFSYDVWMQDWNGGRQVPRHHEIQLQTQMRVGDGSRPFQWGLIVAWVNCDLYYFERQPIIPLWKQLDIEAGRFFRSVEEKKEPDAFGAVIEIPWLTSMFPTREDSVLDLSGEYGHVKTAEDLRQYDYHKAEARGHHNGSETLRAKLLGLAQDHHHVKLPCGYGFRVQKSGKGKTIVPLIPEVPSDPPPVPESILQAG